MGANPNSPHENKVPTKLKSIKDNVLGLFGSPIETSLTPFYLLKNYALLPLAGYKLSDLVRTQMDTSIDAFHSPAAKAKILKDNVAGIKTSYLNPHIQKANESIKTNLEDVLTRSKTGFETLKAGLEKLLPDPVARTKLAFLNAIEDKPGADGLASLQTTRALSDDLKQYQLRMEALFELLKTPNAIDNPRVITAYVKEQYKQVLEQLKAKKTADLEKITVKMTAFRAGNHFTPSECAELEATLKKELEEAYDKAEKGLDKDFKTGVKPEKKEGKDVDEGTPSLFDELDKATRQAEAELHNFVLFAEKSKSKSLVVSGLSAGLGAGALSQGRIYRDVSFDDYAKSIPERDSSWLSVEAWMQYAQFLMNNNGVLVTPTGLRLNYSDNGVQFTFPSAHSFYHHYQDRLLGADMMMMVNEIVKQGKKEITLELTSCDDPELRKVLMEEFYYAAHLAGFPDDKIKFQIAGCPRAKSEEEQKPIDNKTAAECMGMLGSAPSRAQQKKQAWQAEQDVLDVNQNIELKRDVKALAERIEEMLDPNQAAIAGLGRP